MVNLREALSYIDPSLLDYSEWLYIGMGLKHASNVGYAVSWADWDNWSAQDTERYHPGECQKKWDTFNSEGIRINTVIHHAIESGFTPLDKPRKLEFDDVIDDGIPPQEEDDFHVFLRALFDREDLVNIVTKSTLVNGKYIPASKGFNKPSKTLISDFIKTGEIESAIDDYDHEAGVWVRVNPVDGQGVKNENITRYKYTLIESDETDVQKQLDTIIKLRLPCVAITTSGRRSIHAIVKVDAPDYEEYRQRVQFIHSTLEEINFPVDKNNKNPSRLTRLPGVKRGNNKQELLFVHTGYPDFSTWREYVENGFKDVELPEIKKFIDVWGNLPDLAPELIEGVLRQGHKMLLAGSSKAGKSFCLIELGVALAEGGKWLGFQCRKSKVLYINLEIEEASFFHRVSDVYEAIEVVPSDDANFNVWNLRGKAQPMHKLTQKVINRIRSECYDAIILDPVYKVQSGDENAAGDIAAFTNEFDRLTTELGVSLIYCHHHSKGNQGGKRAIDRASGSGVFARDPDAILDMIELDTVSVSNDQQYHDCSAWRIEGTLREFPPFEPVNVFFKFPIHEVDSRGLLDNADYKDYSIKTDRNKPKVSEDEKMIEFDMAFERCAKDGQAEESRMKEKMGNISLQTLRKKMSAYNRVAGKKAYERKNGYIRRTSAW